jgi:transaldolase
MEIFLDTANTREIECWLGQGVVDGVTSNPSIMRKDGIEDLQEGAQRICGLLDKRPFSVEVTTNDPREMLVQARMFASWGPNIVVKFPVINEFGESSLGAIFAATREGIAVNATAILSFNQAMLATKAGATYVSIFAGRVADEGNDPAVVIRHVRSWLDQWGYRTRIIVGSIRSAIDVQWAALAGAHVVTIPPAFLPKMLDHKYTRDTVRQFNRDAEAVLQRAKGVSVGSKV